MVRRRARLVVSPGRTPSPSVARGSRQTVAPTVSGPSTATTSRPATGAMTLEPFLWRGVRRGGPPEVGRSNRSCEPESRVAGDRYNIGPSAWSMLRISVEDSFNDVHELYNPVIMIYCNCRRLVNRSIEAGRDSSSRTRYRASPALVEDRQLALSRINTGVTVSAVELDPGHFGRIAGEVGESPRGRLVAVSQ